MATILLVDDDIDLVAIQREILEKEDFLVRALNNSCKVAPRVETATDLPAAIIVDLVMERDDAGFTVCHRVKRHPNTGRIPIRMLTGVSKARNIGFDLKSPAARKWVKADDFAEKPIRPEHLLARVHHLLGQAAERSAGH